MIAKIGQKARKSSRQAEEEHKKLLMKGKKRSLINIPIPFMLFSVLVI